MKAKHFRISAAALVASVLIQPMAFSAQVEKFDVHLVPEKFTLYTDPYNGNQIEVGGFSGLYPVPGQADHFYVVTDRGPAPDFVDEDGVTLKTFAVPDFGPHIITLRLQPNSKAKIENIMPLRRPDGSIISGLPTTLPPTDIPYDFNLNLLPFDEDSIDAEGITIDPWGNFWVCEEYKPSVALVSPNGIVQMRLIPAGTLTGLEQVPTFDILPAVLAKRRNNRGLEGIAASSDGILYAVMQRPVNNPNRAAADANGNARILAVNLNALLHGAPEILIRQYLYRVPPANGSVTLSDLFSTEPGKLLVTERVTDKLFEVDLTAASDLTLFETADGKLISNPARTLEQLTTAELDALEIVAVTKTVVIDSLMAIDPLLEKVEGLCVVGDQIILTHDNDFNVAEIASTPANPNPNGPFVQLELIGANHPRIYKVRLP